jgi:hypothetical protein
MDTTKIDIIDKGTVVVYNDSKGAWEHISRNFELYKSSFAPSSQRYEENSKLYQDGTIANCPVKVHFAPDKYSIFGFEIMNPHPQPWKKASGETLDKLLSHPLTQRGEYPFQGDWGNYYLYNAYLGVYFDN